MDKPNLQEPTNLSEMFEAAKPELSSIHPNTIVQRLVSRERVLELSARLLSSWPKVAPAAKAAFSDEYYADHQQRAAGLAERAWVFYSADLDVGTAYSNETRREREALSTRVRKHDRRLMLWAKLDFEGDAQAEETLADIAPKHGRRDDAEDVVRLVKMFRQAAKEGLAISVSKAELDAAETDAKHQLDLLSVDPGSAARLLAGQAYTAWYRDYDALMAAGRFLTRGEPGSLTSFPGVRMASVRRGAEAKEVEVETAAAAPDEAPQADALDTVADGLGDAA